METQTETTERRPYRTNPFPGIYRRHSGAHEKFEVNLFGLPTHLHTRNGGKSKLGLGTWASKTAAVRIHNLVASEIKGGTDGIDLPEADQPLEDKEQEDRVQGWLSKVRTRFLEEAAAPPPAAATGGPAGAGPGGDSHSSKAHKRGSAVKKIRRKKAASGSRAMTAADRDSHSLVPRDAGAIAALCKDVAGLRDVTAALRHDVGTQGAKIQTLQTQQRNTAAVQATNDATLTRVVEEVGTIKEQQGAAASSNAETAANLAQLSASCDRSHTQLSVMMAQLTKSHVAMSGRVQDLMR